MNDLVRTIDLAAPVERVWRFLTEPEKLAAWLMDSDIVPVEGTAFSFTADAAGRWDGVIHCVVTEVIEQERIAYTWEANDIGATTLVTFDLTQTATGTRLTLTHADFGGAAGGAMGRHAAGWSRHLRLLRRLFLQDPLAYDWTELQVTYYVNAPMDSVNRLWTTSKGLSEFWPDHAVARTADGLPRSADAAFDNGDRISVRFSTGAETELEILSIQQESFVHFSFGADYGYVQVDLSAEQDRTKIVLRHFGLPETEDAPWSKHAQARGWWIAILMNIQSVLSAGHDLRIRRPGFENCLSAWYPAEALEGAATHDWSAFDVFLHIDATQERVMSYWQTPSAIASFFVRSMQLNDRNGNALNKLTRGATYHWQFVHDYALDGEILDAEPLRVSFTFGSAGIVTVSTQPTAHGCLIHLRQEGMQDTAAHRVHSSLNCRSCWIYFLVALKALAETGADLRDLDPVTADAISVGYNLPEEASG